MLQINSFFFFCIWNKFWHQKTQETNCNNENFTREFADTGNGLHMQSGWCFLYSFYYTKELHHFIAAYVFKELLRKQTLESSHFLSSCCFSVRVFQLEVFHKNWKVIVGNRELSFPSVRTYISSITPAGERISDPQH